MNVSLIIMVVSALAVAGCFPLGALLRDSKRFSDKRRQVATDAVGVALALCLLIFVESVLQYARGFSFASLLASGSVVPFAIFFMGAVQGIIYEYVGQFTFPLWYYPLVERKRYLLLALPFFWGIFMLIMQDTWAIFRAAGVDAWLAFLLVAFVQLALIEGFNLVTHSWKYRGFANTLYFLIPGWLILALTFVIANNYFYQPPFGL